MRLLKSLSRKKKAERVDPKLLEADKGELIHTMHRCSKHEFPFMIIWHRNARNEKFEVKEIIYDFENVYIPVKPRTNKKQNNPFDQYAVDEFDFSKRCCPWCKWDGPFVTCECGENLCLREGYIECGKEMFYHQRCGERFELGDAATINASISKPSKGKKALAAEQKMLAKKQFLLGRAADN